METEWDLEACYRKTDNFRGASALAPTNYRATCVMCELTELAQKEGKSRQWIVCRVRFGAFLTFATTVAKTNSLPVNLTEARRGVLLTPRHWPKPASTSINEVAAVTRRLIGGLFGGTIVPANIAKVFESKAGMDRARNKLRNGTDAHVAIGHPVIRAYLGQGNPKRSCRAQHRIDADVADSIARRLIEALLEFGTIVPNSIWLDNCPGKYRQW
jgi:hypothetical protein